MADAERREILAFVPRSKSGDGAMTFVCQIFLPIRRFGIRQMNGGVDLGGGTTQNETK